MDVKRYKVKSDMNVPFSQQILTAGTDRRRHRHQPHGDRTDAIEGKRQGMQRTRMLIDSTTVAVAARGRLTLPAALPMLAETVEEDGVYYSPSALDQLQHLDQTRSVVIYLPTGQAHAADWFREQGFTIGRTPFDSLAKEADVIVLPEHRDGEHLAALRVPVLRLGEVAL